MKTRVLSALVGIAVLIVVLNFFETPVLNVAIMVIALLAVYEFLTATKISHNNLLSAVAYLVAATFPYIGLKKEMNLLPIFLLPYIALLFLILLRTHKDTRVEDVAMVFMMSIGIPLSLSSPSIFGTTTAIPWDCSTCCWRCAVPGTATPAPTLWAGRGASISSVRRSARTKRWRVWSEDW